MKRGSCNARNCIIPLFLLLLIPFSSEASCQFNEEDLMRDLLNLGDTDKADVSIFQNTDPRDIGRALDISSYSLSDDNSFMELIKSVDCRNDDGAAVMNFETYGVLAMQEANKNLKRFVVPDTLTIVPAGSFTHLDMFNYSASEWDQTGGSDEHCGNCWVWADTGALQLDMAYHQNMTERLSVQYFTSSYHNGTGIWACCGGSPVWFADFYNTTKKAIPVTNINASFVDSRSIGDKGDSTAMDASYISTTPYYSIDQISAEMIRTNSRYEGRKISNETAINSIKAALQSEKAVLILYTPDDWSGMMDFWTNQTSEDIFVPVSGTDATHNDGGHVMLILGYDDSDPENRYWQVLNSWGGPDNRPDGLFKLTMDLDYSLQCPDGVNSYEFYVLNVTYPKMAAENES